MFDTGDHSLNDDMSSFIIGNVNLEVNVKLDNQGLSKNQHFFAPNTIVKSDQVA